MRFEKERPEGIYSIVIDFAGNEDPEELRVGIGFQPANRTSETFLMAFYMIVVDDRYVPYGISRTGQLPPVSLRRFAPAVARCAYRFLEAHDMRVPVRTVEI